MNENYDINRYKKWHEDVIFKLNQMMIDCILDIYECNIKEGKMFLCDNKCDYLPNRYKMYCLGPWDDDFNDIHIGELVVPPFGNPPRERSWDKFCEVKNECENIAKELNVRWENPVSDSVAVTGYPLYSSFKNKYEYKYRSNKNNNKYEFNKFEYKF